MGLMVGTVVPVVWQARLDAQREMELPDSYVGVLATAKGEPGLIVSSLRRGKVVDLKQLTPIEVPQGKTLYLWRIDKAGAITAVAPLPSGQFTRVTLDEPAEQVFFPAVELAVSLETAGATPAIPTQPFVYRGLCGKLWR
ncbi:MAG: anti-sigma factor, partial [Hydrogenophaga sp.]|nr:anti-sigma factor [Hydrogenophaga sp.]